MSENKNLPVLGTKEVFKPIKQSNLIIEKIEFVDAIPNLDEIQNKWDVSDKWDGSIMAWLDGDTLKISGNGKILANENCNCLFKGFRNIFEIKFNGLVDTCYMSVTRRMFAGCKKLKRINLTNWDTQNLENVRWMFGGCESLKKVITSCDKIIDEIDDETIIQTPNK